MSPAEPRQELVAFARLAWERGLCPASDGNLSLRLADGRVLITPSGSAKGFLRPEDLLEVDQEGRVLAGAGRPSAELGLHLAVYRAHPEARAVLHAHPPLATAVTLAGLDLDLSGLPEALHSLGAAPTAPYATPGSPELVAAVEPYLPGRRAILLAHHGSLAWGPDLLTAFARSEKLEHAARVMLAARSLGGTNPLPPEEQDRLRALGAGQEPGPLAPLAQRIRLAQLPRTPEFATEKIHHDARGEAHLIVDDRPIRRLAVITQNPGQGWRGRHVHQRKHEGFYVFRGRARAELVCASTGERLELILEPGARLELPPGVAHRFAALDEELVFVEFTDHPYQAEDDAPFAF